ncbi:CsbD family protein [Cryptosporangium aurantiacum]|uniref:CsbD-like n=1 Tax=Cryptosporangium aurantiacum TaxID=134849 RepID=A0A1M7RNQ6_9ACTN|nr:CsbD family protein [Cryptosporangium aurantiacum]SHN47780.1 CsbD-like [Cryptosporangium aurantiacum]
MSFDDKAENKAQELKGTAKERWGGATGDESLQAEGAADRSESKVKQAGEHLKDAAKSVKDVFKK